MIFRAFITFCAIFACFLFGAGCAATAAKSFANENWTEFGHNLMLTVCFTIAIMYILGISLF